MIVGHIIKLKQELWKVEPSLQITRAINLPCNVSPSLPLPSPLLPSSFIFSLLPLSFLTLLSSLLLHLPAKPCFCDLTCPLILTTYESSFSVTSFKSPHQTGPHTRPLRHIAKPDLKGGRQVNSYFQRYFAS